VEDSQFARQVFEVREGIVFQKSHGNCRFLLT